MYDDIDHFMSVPSRPVMVILFTEISSLTMGQIKASALLVDHKNRPGGSEKLIYLMTVHFHTNYQKSVQQIWNFKYQNLDKEENHRPDDQCSSKDKAMA